MKFAAMYRGYIEKLKSEYEADREMLETLWAEIGKLEETARGVRENRMLSEIGKRERLDGIESELRTARGRLDGFTAEAARKWKSKVSEMKRESWARRYMMNPAEIDSGLLAIVNSGLCSLEELETLADEYRDNKTMCRFIAAAIRSAADDAEPVTRARAMECAMEIDGESPRELEAAQDMIAICAAGLRADKVVADGSHNRVFPDTYADALEAADGITGETA